MRSSLCQSLLGVFLAVAVSCGGTGGRSGPMVTRSGSIAAQSESMAARSEPVAATPNRLPSPSAAEDAIATPFSALVSIATPASTGKPLAAGMNLSPINDWNREWPFVDVFKHSRAWLSQDRERMRPWNNHMPIELNAEGWPILQPGQSVATLMCVNQNGHYPGGVYTCTFEGTGKIEFRKDGRVIEGSESGNRLQVLVKPTDEGMIMRVLESDPQDPVRNIKVWMPGFENAESPFHPLFVERLRPFKVIRFMNWAQINKTTVAHWSDRTTPDSPRQSGTKGVAIEYMVDLCNELGADPWFCMPHLADDDFVRRYAELVKARLHGGGKVYVEWSNEAWNLSFPQGQWVRQQAQARGVSIVRVIAEETQRDWKIWREVFADEPERVVRVAAGQAHGPRIMEGLLEAMDGECDAVACAAYFGPRDASAEFNEFTTPQEAISAAVRYLVEDRLPLLRRHKEMADLWSQRTGRHIAFMTYEGGPGFSALGRRVPFLDAYIRAQTDPKMGEAYRTLLSSFQEIGGEVFVAFQYASDWNRYGCWGHLLYQDQPIEEAIKYRTLVEMVGATPK